MPWKRSKGYSRSIKQQLLSEVTKTQENVALLKHEHDIAQAKNTIVEHQASMFALSSTTSMSY